MIRGYHEQYSIASKSRYVICSCQVGKLSVKNEFLKKME